MPYDAQGKPHHSASRAAFSDKANEGKKPAAAAAPAKEKPQGEGKEHDVSQMNIRDVVKQHGPAHEVHIFHDHEAGEHKVHSIHGEKHHHSQHDSADAAHHHARMAAGVMNPDQQEPTEEPDEANAAPQMASASIPGM